MATVTEVSKWDVRVILITLCQRGTRILGRDQEVPAIFVLREARERSERPSRWKVP